MAARDVNSNPSASLSMVLSELAAHPELVAAVNRPQDAEPEPEPSLHPDPGAVSSGSEPPSEVLVSSEAADDPLEEPEETAPTLTEEEPEAEASEEEEPHVLTFRERVEEKIPMLRYINNLHRPVYTPEELARLKVVDRRSSMFMPVITLAALVICAVGSVALAVRIVGNETASSEGKVVTVVLIAAVLVLCFYLLLQAQDFWDNQKPSGRNVRTDIADAYEIVRDAPYMLIELQSPHDLLLRVAELQPVAEKLIDFIVVHEATSTLPMKGHPAYNEMIRMAAEVEVILEMRQEKLGLRLPPGYGEPWATRLPGGRTVVGFQSLVDIAENIGRSPEEIAEAKAAHGQASPAAPVAPAPKAAVPEHRRVVDAKTIG